MAITTSNSINVNPARFFRLNFIRHPNSFSAAKFSLLAAQGYSADKKAHNHAFPKLQSGVEISAISPFAAQGSAATGSGSLTWPTARTKSEPLSAGLFLAAEAVTIEVACL
jgi:hypothetical protein